MGIVPYHLIDSSALRETVFFPRCAAKEIVVMAKIGRPRALDEVKWREVCALVSAGCGIADAARYIGCSASTVRREALRNESFHQSLRMAEMSAQLEPLKTMRKAASTHWRAAAWMLERTFPDRFARQDAKLLKPEDVDSMVHGLIEMVAQEIADPATRDRVYRRLLAGATHLKQEAAAVEKPRRDPSRAQRMLGKTTKGE